MASQVHRTYHLILAGNSEKQAAMALGLSWHTAHVYVKQIYLALGINSQRDLYAAAIESMRSSKSEVKSMNPDNAPAPRRQSPKNILAIKKAAMVELGMVIKKLAGDIDPSNLEAMLVQLDIINRVRRVCEEIDGM